MNVTAGKINLIYSCYFMTVYISVHTWDDDSIATVKATGVVIVIKGINNIRYNTFKAFMTHTTMTTIIIIIICFTGFTWQQGVEATQIKVIQKAKRIHEMSNKSLKCGDKNHQQLNYCYCGRDVGSSCWKRPRALVVMVQRSEMWRGGWSLKMLTWPGAGQSTLDSRHRVRTVRGINTSRPLISTSTNIIA